MQKFVNIHGTSVEICKKVFNCGKSYKIGWYAKHSGNQTFGDCLRKVSYDKNGHIKYEPAYTTRFDLMFVLDEYFTKERN